MAGRSRRIGFLSAAIGALLVCFSLSPQIQAGPREDAATAEANGQWPSAALIYAKILSTDRSDTEAREHYKLCLRHIHQARRLRDAAFRDDLLNRGLDSSLKAYDEILRRVIANYVDDKKATPALLFQYGLQEFRFALEDKQFIDAYLARADASKIRDFSDSLSRFTDRDVTTVKDARALVRELTLDAVTKLELPEAVVVVEFAFGACNSLDEYTVCLTPSQFKDLKALQDGSFVGIGIDLVVENNNLLVGSVYPGSPAADQLKSRDRIVSIDGKAVEPNVETAAARLRGAENTKVKLEIVSGDVARTVELERRHFAVKTVENVHPLETPGVGYFKVNAFGKNTRNEIVDAIGTLKSMDAAKAVVIDLRDCGGGIFGTAIDSAGLFLPSGVIASTQSRNDNLNKTYRADNSMAFDMPIVVLVNNETASAAELFAAALRDNPSCHAVIVGRTNTFGKNTIQYPLAVNSLGTGMRITIARFFPPSKQDFSGTGLAPDHVLEISGDMPTLAILEAELRFAETVAGRLLLMNE